MKIVFDFKMSGFDYPHASIALGGGISYGQMLYCEKKGAHFHGVVFSFGCLLAVLKIYFGKEYSD